MPRFFFDIQNGHRLIDPSGLDCADQVISRAKIIARQIAQEPSGQRGQRHIAVLDGQRAGGRETVAGAEIPLGDEVQHLLGEIGREIRPGRWRPGDRERVGECAHIVAPRDI